MKLRDQIIKVVLLKVMPGMELLVIKSIQEEFHSQEMDDSNFKIYRLFGNYDILITYETGPVGKRFARAGTIPFITGSREFLCYNWVMQNDRKRCGFEINKIDKPLLATCFFKIDPFLNSIGTNFEIGFSKYLVEKTQNVQFLGTLGWSEYILFINHSNLNNLFEELENILKVVVKYDVDHDHNIAEKTLSIIGYDVKLGYDDSLPQINLSSVDDKNEIQVNIKIACKPRCMEDVRNSAVDLFKVNKDEVGVLLGVNDLEFQIDKDKISSLNSLVSTLDKFREFNQTNLLRTYTDLQYKRKVGKFSKENQPRFYNPIIVELTKGDIDQILKIEYIGGEIINTIYYFNNLIQNELLTETYEDLLRNVQQLKSRALTLSTKELTFSNKEELIEKIFYLQYALYERAQGVYVGIEEAPLGSVPFSAGNQRFLKALEVYPHIILKRLNLQWNGYCVVSYNSTKYQHSYEIIIVPTIAAKNPWMHWGLTHEIMHVLLFENHKVLDFNDALQNQMSLDLLEEVVCDILDYIISCPLSINKYLNIVWSYIKGHLFNYNNQIKSYLIRSFSVFVFNDIFLKNKNIDTYFNLNNIINKFDIFIGIINEHIPPNVLDTYEDNQATLRENTIYSFDRIRDVIISLHNKLNEMDVQINLSKNPKIIKTLIKSLKRLKDGFIIEPEYIQYADLIAWLIRDQGQDSIGQIGTLAYILSLWNYYSVSNLGFNLSTIWTKD